MSPLTHTRRLLLRLQDGCFDVLFRAARARGYFERARRCDEPESVCEARGFEELAGCRCGAGQRAAVHFRAADRYDRAERRGWQLAEAEVRAQAAEYRVFSGDVERGRVLAFRGGQDERANPLPLRR